MSTYTFVVPVDVAKDVHLTLSLTNHHLSATDASGAPIPVTDWTLHHAGVELNVMVHDGGRLSVHPSLADGSLGPALRVAAVSEAVA